jgi:hypothetical protein
MVVLLKHLGGLFTHENKSPQRMSRAFCTFTLAPSNVGASAVVAGNQSPWMWPFSVSSLVGMDEK